MASFDFMSGMHEGFGDDAIKGDWLTERIEKEAVSRVPWGKVAAVGGLIGGLLLLVGLSKRKDT